MLATVRAKFPQVRTPSRGPRGFSPLPPHPLCPCALRRRGTFRPASSRAHWRTPTPPCCYSMRARRTRCVAAHEAMRALLRCCRDCGPASPPLAVRSCARALMQRVPWQQQMKRKLRPAFRGSCVSGPAIMRLTLGVHTQYDVSHIAGAHWVGEDGEVEQLPQLISDFHAQHEAARTKLVACYCSVGYRCLSSRREGHRMSL